MCQRCLSNWYFEDGQLYSAVVCPYPAGVTQVIGVCVTGVRCARGA